MEPNGHLSPKDVSRLTGLSLATVHRYLRSGRLPAAQPGGRRHRLLIPADALGPLLRPKASPPPPGPAAPAGPAGPPPLPGPRPRWLGDTSH